MDDLYIKMLANKKKLSSEKTSEASSLGSKDIQYLFQILEKNYFPYQSVSGNLREFAKFIENNSAKIISAFEKTLTGKGE